MLQHLQEDRITSCSYLHDEDNCVMYRSDIPGIIRVVLYTRDRHIRYLCYTVVTSPEYWRILWVSKWACVRSYSSFVIFP